MSTLRRKLKRYETPNHARYLTFSCYRRLPLFKNDKIKQVFVDQLDLTRQRLDFILYAWVIMPEHVHLLLMPNLESATVRQILHALKRPVSENILARWRRLDAGILTKLTDTQNNPHFWQPGGGYDRNIFTTDELLEKIQYIHTNPVRRGLVKHETDWPWSSARWYDRKKGLPMDTLPL